MLSIPSLSLFLVISPLLVGIQDERKPIPPTPAPAFTVPVPQLRLNVEPLLAMCDRFVLARIAKIHEYDRVGSRIAPDGTGKYRIAELGIVSAAFGSKTERLFVRLPDGPAPTGLALWPLSRNLDMGNDNSEAFERIEAELKADPLWMPTFWLQAPWTVTTVGSDSVAEIPDIAFSERDADHPLDYSKPLPKRSRSVMRVEQDIAAEVARFTPRTEAYISGHAVGWHAEVDGSGKGSFNNKITFAWSDAERSTWDGAVAKFEYANMPSEIENSSGPCSAILCLSRVTAEGRRTVRYYGNAPRDGVRDPWGPRFESLWAALHEQLPKEAQ